MQNLSPLSLNQQGDKHQPTALDLGSLTDYSENRYENPRIVPIQCHKPLQYIILRGLFGGSGLQGLYGKVCVCVCAHGLGIGLTVANQGRNAARAKS